MSNSCEENVSISCGKVRRGKLAWKIHTATPDATGLKQRRLRLTLRLSIKHWFRQNCSEDEPQSFSGTSRAADVYSIRSQLNESVHTETPKQYPPSEHDGPAAETAMYSGDLRHAGALSGGYPVRPGWYRVGVQAAGTMGGKAPVLFLVQARLSPGPVPSLAPLA